MKLRSLLMLFLLALSACSSVKYYHIENHYKSPYGKTSDYAEMQLHSNGTYKEFRYSRSDLYPNQNGIVLDGNFSFHGDTLNIIGFVWNYTQGDTSYKVVDSNFIYTKYLINRKKLSLIYGTGLEMKATFSVDTVPFVSDTIYAYKRGQSKQFHQIEKLDSIIWINEYYMSSPGNLPKKHHGLDGRTINNANTQ